MVWCSAQKVNFIIRQVSDVCNILQHLGSQCEKGRFPNPPCLNAVITSEKMHEGQEMNLVTN